MTTDSYLMRSDAPFAAEVWQAMDNAMVGSAKSVLTARRILPVEGPYGLGLKSIPLPDEQVEEGRLVSRGLPLSLFTRPFTLSKRDLASFERDPVALNLKHVAEASMSCARAEDNLLFNGSAEAPGLLTAEGANHVSLAAWTKIGAATNDIIGAVTVLDAAGFHGPYALALAPRRYNLLLRRFPDGMTSELEHVKTIAAQGVFKAPALERGGVLLTSAVQFSSIVLGQDMAISFLGPDGEKLEFSVSESLALNLHVPASVCVLGE